MKPKLCKAISPKSKNSTTNFKCNELW